MDIKEEERDKFLDERFLKKLAEKYSQFIDFPIYVWSEENVTKEVEIEEKEEEQKKEETNNENKNTENENETNKNEDEEK